MAGKASASLLLEANVLCPLPDPHDALHRRRRKAAELVVDYAGSHSSANSSRMVAGDAACARGALVAFVLGGHGRERAALQARDAERRIDTRSGGGVVVRGEGPCALASAVRGFAAVNECARPAIGERGRGYVRTHHTYDVLANRVRTVFNNARQSRVAA